MIEFIKKVSGKGQEKANSCCGVEFKEISDREKEKDSCCVDDSDTACCGPEDHDCC